jgi:hypothetical protein
MNTPDDALKAVPSHEVSKGASEVIAALEVALEAQPLTTPGVTFVEKADLRALLDAHASALRDAERYRQLRRGSGWSVIDWKGDVLSSEELDAAIDSARAAMGANTKGAAE